MLSPGFRLTTALGMIVGLAIVIGGVVFAFTRIPDVAPVRATTPDTTDTAKKSDMPKPRAPVIFKDHDPDLVLMLTGQMHGYLQPCGCARPQVGGLERRFELWKDLRARGWPISAADLGDLAPKESDIAEQTRAKYETAMQVLKEMEYAAVGLGTTEVMLPLDQALSIALNYEPVAVLAANLIDKKGDYQGFYKPFVIHETPAVGMKRARKVGYVCVIGSKAAAEMKKANAALDFDPPEKVLPEIAEKLSADKAGVWVLLVQGKRDEARALATKFPQFHVVLALDESDEPPTLAESIKDDMGKETGRLLITTGHKGKNVGLVAVVFQEGKPELRYQLVTMTEYFELPDDKTNPAREKMRDYVLTVQRNDYLSKWARGQHKLQLDARFTKATFVGSAACKECHPKTYDTWSKSKHAKAYEGLQEYGRPIAFRQLQGQPPQRIGREFDPECIRCHVTAFNYHGGFTSAAKTPNLFGNGCENCHGPASLHVEKERAKADDRAAFALPLRLSKGSVEYDCRKCHDGDNDPKFDLDSYWEKIKHGRE